MNSHDSRRAIELAKKYHPELMTGFVAENDDLFMHETSEPEVTEEIVDSAPKSERMRLC